MSEFSIINLRGRELQVCTFYQPPVSYLNRTIKKIINGIEEEVFLADNGKQIFYKTLISRERERERVKLINIIITLDFN